MLQNFPYLSIKKREPKQFFSFFILSNFEFFALDYVDIDQDSKLLEMKKKQKLLGFSFSKYKYLERVVSIESRKSPQCSTNVIGAFQGYTL